MGFVLGFLPWILYWVLVGNVDFRVAVCVPLAVAVGTEVVSRMRGQPWRSLEVGSLLIFVLLAAAANRERPLAGVTRLCRTRCQLGRRRGSSKEDRLGTVPRGLGGTLSLIGQRCCGYGRRTRLG
jgi:hypothetical protein